MKMSNSSRWAFLSAVGLLIAFVFSFWIVFTAEADETVMTPPPQAQCPQDGALLWSQTVDVNNLDPNGVPIVQVRFTRFGTNVFEIPGPYPQILATGPVTVTVPDAVAWDGYTTRNLSALQPNERFKIVFIKDGEAIAETGYTGDAGDDGIQVGWLSDFWQGPIGGEYFFPNGVDQILLVHWSDVTFGTGDKSSPNSVVPTSVCIQYDTPTAITLSSSGAAPAAPIGLMTLILAAALATLTGVILARRKVTVQ